MKYRITVRPPARNRRNPPPHRPRVADAAASFQSEKKSCRRPALLAAWRFARYGEARIEEDAQVSCRLRSPRPRARRDPRPLHGHAVVEARRKSTASAAATYRRREVVYGNLRLRPERGNILPFLGCRGGAHQRRPTEVANERAAP